MHLHMTDNVRLLGLASIQFEPDSLGALRKSFLRKFQDNLWM